MSPGKRVLCVAGVLGLAAVAGITLEARRTCRGDCYAVCKYEGKSGSTYVGASAGGCDSACEAAEKKCSEKEDTPCQKIRCTATDCN